MKRYLILFLIALFAFPSALLANEKYAGLKVLEESLVHDLPQAYQKAHSFSDGDIYKARYEKVLPRGKDPFDAYEFEINKKTLEVVSTKKLYQHHELFDEKKLISDKKLEKLISPFFTHYDSLNLSVVNPPKLTQYNGQSTGKTELRYAYIVKQEEKTLYIDAYDGDILGFESFQKTLAEDLEPDSFFLKLWQSIVSWFK